MPISYIETASLDTALNAPTATALSTASGSAPSYSARAWVNFNGTGTVAIRASGNVSSITDNGTGWYTINFTTAMPDANYSAPMAASNGSNYSNTVEPLTVNAASLGVYCWSRGTSASGNSVATDMITVAVSIFR